MSVLDRSALEASPLADLHAIASELGLDGFRRLRKADLVDAILARQGGEEDSGEAATATEEDAGEPATATEAEGDRGARPAPAAPWRPRPRAGPLRGGRLRIRQRRQAR